MRRIPDNGTDSAIRPGRGRLARPWLWSLATGLAFFSGSALAFPFFDATNQGTGEATTALSGPDAQDLTHQLQIANGLPGPGTAGGWTIQPRLSLQEALTDNVLQVHSPMRWDLTTVLSPGIMIAGQTHRANVRLDYAPLLIVNARTGSQNALNQQLNATATITAIDELAYIDIRALSGIQSLRGGAAAGGGTIGDGDIGGLSASQTAGTGGTAAGNSQQSTVQTSSIGISPYLVKRFGDYGTARIGYSLNLSQSSPASGFKFIPFPSGASTQRLVTTEQTAQFKSGDFLNDFQDTIDIDFSQSSSSGQNIGAGSIATNGALTSRRQIVSNALSYAVNRFLVATVSIGHENISYNGAYQQAINDITWSVGGTFTPNQYSSITIGYGHQQGASSLSFNGHLQLTPRTIVSASYSETLGTQLENLQQQLNRGVVGANGSFVNGQTGGQLFGSTNGAPVQSGVFRFKNLTATATTQLDRDTIGLTLNTSNQTSTGASASLQLSSQSNGIILQWTHDLHPDLRLSTSASYNTITGSIGGSSQSIAFNAGLIYTLTSSLSASARYSFFKSTSQNTLYSLYEDIVVIGITRQF